MYIRRKVFSLLQDEDGEERYFSTTEYELEKDFSIGSFIGRQSGKKAGAIANNFIKRNGGNIKNVETLGKQFKNSNYDVNSKLGKKINNFMGNLQGTALKWDPKFMRNNRQYVNSAQKAANNVNKNAVTFLNHL